MLIFTLKEGESMLINDDVKVLFKDVKKSHVKILLDAPKEIKVRRSIATQSEKLNTI
jgi:carbon storage regulator CsrA